MFTLPEGRWPPVYDAEDLKRVIKELIASKEFDARFWDLRPIDHGLVCQGDIIHLDSAVPVIDEDGEPVATDDCSLWMSIGNTCDFSRDVKDVPWNQMVPLVDITDVDRSNFAAFRGYQYSRHFYVPPWPESNQHYFADFTRAVTVHKNAFMGPARIVARLQMHAWVLLHACLVRFLARDDGRNSS